MAHPLARPAGHATASDPVARGYTLVSFHAHPDDEALFTGGTLAKAAAEGHRVVLVVATYGERGLTGQAVADLAAERKRELDRAADALGIHRVIVLGYADSGMVDPPTPLAGSLCAASVDDVAADLVTVLQEEHADVLTIYDAVGGYGHRDHVRVHEAGLRAAQLARTPVVVQATVKREAIRRAVRLLGLLRIRPGGMTPAAFSTTYTARRDITHEVDVRPWARQKQSALRAHASQTTGGPTVRTLTVLVRLPLPLFRLVLGREWYVEIGRRAPREPLDDVFHTLREARP